MTFEEKVKQIESVEKDVDKVLVAARLQRNQADNRRLEMILEFLTFAILMGLVAASFIVPMVLIYLQRRC